MRRIIGTVLIVTMLTMIASPMSLAQEIGAPAPDPEETPAPVELSEDSSWMTCHARGKVDARQQSTAGSGIGGFFGGVVLGLIGTGIAVLAQTETDPPPDLLMAFEDQTEECRYAYIESFRDEYRSKKRSSALAGGLIGTAVLVAVVVVAQGD